MSDEEPIRAPTYNELMKLVNSLKAQVDVLSASPTGASTSCGGSNTEIVPQMEYRVIPDLNQSIKTFTGREEPHEADDWFKSVENLADINMWPLNIRLQFIRTNLSGAAKNWFVDRSFVDWKDFKGKFRGTFIRELRLFERWDKMQRRIQFKGEHIMDYFHDKVRLCRALNMEFSEVRDCLIQGIHQKELAMYVLGRTHINEEALLADLCSWCRMSTLRSSKVTSAGEHSLSCRGQATSYGENKTKAAVSDPEVKNKWPRGSWRSGKITTTDAGQRDTRSEHFKTNTCFHCHKAGHLARECPTKRSAVTCYSCGVVGHYSNECPGKQPAHFVKTANLSEVNPYIKSAIVNGYSVAALLDTGSYYSIMREEVAIKCNLRMLAEAKPMYGFGDMSKVAVTTLGEAEAMIAVDGVEAGPVAIKVVPDNACQFDLLVGRNWIDAPGVVYWKDNGILKLSYSKDCLGIGDATIMRDRQDGPLDELKVVEERIIKQQKPLEVSDLKAIGEDASEQQVSRLLCLLNKYRKCFSLNMSELGCTHMAEMDLCEVEGSRPVVCKPYKTTAVEREKMAEIVGEWKRNGIVVETDSPYASPVILVKQGDKHRLCVDYRKLNKQVKRPNFPLPDMLEQVEALGGGKLFTQLDLATGYLQIPLTQEAQVKTAFVTPDETGQFTRMPFGLAGAPSEFARLMKKVLGNLRNGVVKNYLDDWVIDAQNWEDMLEKLEVVLERLNQANLTLKPSKCSFGVKEIEFLGFVIGSGSIRPGEGKTRAIEKFPPLKDAHSVRRFLGLTGFFRRFVANYALIAEPLTRLTKKNSEFVWGREQEDAYNLLKDKLTRPPVLRMFNPKAAVTEVHTDASAAGVGAMLLQSDEVGGSLNLVYCLSKKLTEAEAKYHSSKLELLSVVYAVTKLRNYLLGIKFVIFTDCQALVFLKTHISKPQIARWSDLLQEYDFDLKYKAGSKMAHVDALSRGPVNKSADLGLAAELESTLCDYGGVYVALSMEERVLMCQTADEELQQLINILKVAKEERTKREDGLVRDFKLINNLLYRKYQGRDLFVMPKSMRKSLVVTAHDLNGHQSVDKTISNLVRDFWFVGMKRYVRQHIRMCFECLLAKAPRGRQPGQLHPIPPGSRPFETVHGDHLGPFISTSSGYKYIFVLVDNLTKFVLLFTCTDTSTEEVLSCVKAFVQGYGLPKRLVTDRGSCFTAKAFEEYCVTEGICHILTSTRRPQANGQVERVNSIILSMLLTQVENAESWDEWIPEVQRQINTSESKTTKYTPFELLHGYRPKFSLGMLRSLSRDGDQWVCPVELWEEAKESIIASQKLSKAAYDKGRHNNTRYVVGEIVVMSRVPKSTGESTKLQERYRGPLVVTEVLKNDTYRVAQLEENTRRQYVTTAHVSQLKSWKLEKEGDEEQGEGGEEQAEGGEDQAEEDNLRDNGNLIKEPSILLPSQESNPIDDAIGNQRPSRCKRKPVWLADYETN